MFFEKSMFEIKFHRKTHNFTNDTTCNLDIRWYSNNFSIFIRSIWIVILNDTLHGLFPIARNETQKLYRNLNLIKSALKSCFSTLQNCINTLDFGNLFNDINLFLFFLFLHVIKYITLKLFYTAIKLSLS